MELFAKCSHPQAEAARAAGIYPYFHELESRQAPEVVMEGKPSEIFSRADELLSLGLDIPVTAKCARILQSRGIKIGTDFTCDDFVKQVLALRGKGGERDDE